MPIYEFYCPDCHAIYQFFSRSINTRKRPPCPDCKRPKLEREVSTFAITGKAKEPGDPDDLPIDEEKMMGAMAAMEREMAGVDENDPRQAAAMMRRFADLTGMPVGGAMEEALGRMEAGEDPEAVEAEMGDLLDGEDPFQQPGKAMGLLRRLRRGPRRDPELYDL